ncbi:DNA mismatch repair protein PMS2 [Paragonimus westermani]|uniref:DNA mismatch repair protein PMS2 n=1 Tax=Paragonimus westermani TaxID=34504 RepID=A0A5J4NKE0_9TREM|nr:DNA mismatch repair protein PMS2 [Paragonimus westermani]
MLSPAISALQSDVVHKICSGQVVVTLASAVKELVENSIDSGATKIGMFCLMPFRIIPRDVRLREYGSELIEVSDNGSGIREQDFDAITGKHSTSKIREFDDLHSVRTFGFRGEALSSLCQLSNLVIHTCAIDASVGSRLEFDSQGIIVTRRPLARSHGTTVFVHQLFHNLPVRRRHLTDPGRLTKEFAKAVSLLTAYCLSTVGVQISCSRITKSGEKIHVVSNGSATSIKDNLAAVYGQHIVNNLVELAEVNTVPNDILDEFNVKTTTDSSSIRVCGFITKPPTQEVVEPSAGSHGSIGLSRGRSGSSSGRSTSDRQFVYVNGRPCELPRLTRLTTDIWRRCSREALGASTNGIRMPAQSTLTQFPLLVLMFHMPTAFVDVNLTPDKRMLFLHHERYVLALTKAALVNTLFRTTGIDVASLSHCDLSQSMISPSTYGPSSAVLVRLIPYDCFNHITFSCWIIRFSRIENDRHLHTCSVRPPNEVCKFVSFCIISFVHKCSHVSLECISLCLFTASLISIVNLDNLSQSMSDSSTVTPLRASGPAESYDQSTTVATELILPETDHNDSQTAQVITDELLSSSRRCRPSRLRDILASRSCRSAVMIGTALDHAKMLRVSDVAPNLSLLVTPQVVIQP